MAVETDETAWLPEAPPPRPARREAAIEAALRKFDGIEDTAPATRERQGPSWARTHRTQLSVFASAFLLVVIGIPAALIGLRNQPTVTERPAPALVAHDSACPGNACPAKPAARPEQPPPADASIARLPQSITPPALRKSRGDEVGLAATNHPEAKAELSAPAAPPPPAAAPPPPPPPPPPAPAQEAASAQRQADEARAQDVVVTGTLVRAPGVSAFERRPTQKTGRVASGASSNEAQASLKQQSYEAFLSRLQTAVRANDRRAIIALIAFPLRVNVTGQSKMYRDAASVERDFDRIFTPQVTRAILNQKTGQLFVRDQGAMIGDGEVWFDHTCSNATCSPAGPVRIKAVNP